MELQSTKLCGEEIHTHGKSAFRRRLNLPPIARICMNNLTTKNFPLLYFIKEKSAIFLRLLSPCFTLYQLSIL